MHCLLFLNLMPYAISNLVCSYIGVQRTQMDFEVAPLCGSTSILKSVLGVLDELVSRHCTIQNLIY